MVESKKIAYTRLSVAMQGMAEPQALGRLPKSSPRPCSSSEEPGAKTSSLEALCQGMGFIWPWIVSRKICLPTSRSCLKCTNSTSSTKAVIKKAKFSASSSKSSRRTWKEMTSHTTVTFRSSCWRLRRTRAKVRRRGAEKSSNFWLTLCWSLWSTNTWTNARPKITLKPSKSR